MSLSWKSQTDIVEAFNSTCRYINDLLRVNTRYRYCSHNVDRVYSVKKTNPPNTEAPISIRSYPYVMVQFPKWIMINGTILIFVSLISHCLVVMSLEIFISQLIRFAKLFPHDIYFSSRNKASILKLLQQSYRYHKQLKAFSVYRRQYDQMEI